MAPPPWFTLVAALVPALPFAIFLPISLLLWYLPLYVACFYAKERLVRYALLPPRLPMCIGVCVFASYRGLVAAGWTGWSLYAVSLICGFLMDLAESALWDTMEPFIFGQEGFGEGKKQPVKLSSQDAQRMNAAASVKAGDPARAAAASAFTQKELDALAAKGFKPDDLAALQKKLGY